MAGLLPWLVAVVVASTAGAEEATEGLTREVLEREPLVTINIQTNQVHGVRSSHSLEVEQNLVN